jgi:hypothetical protein
LGTDEKLFEKAIRKLKLQVQLSVVGKKVSLSYEKILTVRIAAAAYSFFDPSSEQACRGWQNNPSEWMESESSRQTDPPG